MKKDVRDFIVSNYYKKIIKGKEVKEALDKIDEFYECIEDKKIVDEIDAAMNVMASTEAKENYILGFKAAFRKNNELKGKTLLIKTTRKAISEIYWERDEVTVTKEIKKTYKDFDGAVEKLKDKKTINEIQDISIELIAAESNEAYILGFKDGLSMIKDLVVA